MSTRNTTGMKLAILATLVLALLAGLTLPALAETGISKQSAEWLIAKLLTVTGDTDLQGDLNVDEDVTIAGALAVTGNVAGTGDISANDLTLSGNIASRALVLRLQDVADDTATNVLAATAVATTTHSITTAITNPDYPRNVVVTLSSTAQRTAGNITLTGVDARGTATTELLAMTAITVSQTLTGNVPWASITSVAIPTQTRAFTISVGLGEKFGLPLIPVASGDVFKVTKTNVHTTAFTVNTTYGTVGMTADVSANDDFGIWVKQ